MDYSTRPPRIPGPVLDHPTRPPRPRRVALGLGLAAIFGAAVAILCPAGKASALPTVLNPIGPNGRISACYSSAGAVTLVNPGAGCASGTPISWVAYAPSAVVDRTGVLLHGQGVQLVQHVSTGVYNVFFNYAQAGACTQVATDANQGNGMVAVEGGQVSGNNVRVQTFNSRGLPADLTFQVILSC